MIFFEIAFVALAFLAIGFALGRQLSYPKGYDAGYKAGARDEAAKYVQDNQRVRVKQVGRVDIESE